MSTDDPFASPETAAGIADLEPVAPARRRRPVRWAVSGVVVVALVAAGLAFALGGSGKGSPASAVVLSDAAARTTSSGPAQVTSTASLAIGGRSIKFLDVSGATDYGVKTGSVTLHLGALTEQVRSIKGNTYMAVPGIAIPHGAHWVELTPADLRLDPNASSLAGSTDPGSGLGFLSALEGNPRVVDHGTVDGATVTHYAFTLDFVTFFAKVGTASAALKDSTFAKSIKVLGGLVDLSKVPGEAWIDSAGRVRRFEFSFTLTEAGQSATFSDETDFSHFGEPVAGAAPAASDTVSVKDVPDFFTKIAQAGAQAGEQAGLGGAS